MAPEHSPFSHRLLHRVYPITLGLAQGPYPELDHATHLTEFGVTAILNVCDQPSEIEIGVAGITATAWVPIQDRIPIPPPAAIESLRFIHQSLTSQGVVYVHCLAGWNRSATIVWLYLVACGLPPEHCRIEMGKRTLDAVPGHPALLSAELMDEVLSFGRWALIPHPRPDMLRWSEPLLTTP